ncbi:hypothetical protein BASA81_004894 [Batrachochytrium salamandrivorans]|nr:hypothetical protein BASA81_004894 [Batrachochytrium salamandrivorans]
MREHRLVLLGAAFLLLVIGLYVSISITRFDGDFTGALFAYSNHQEIPTSELPSVDSDDGGDVVDSDGDVVDSDDGDVVDNQTEIQTPTPIPDKIMGDFCENPIRFLGQEEGLKNPVALASFPGSGNTWLRFLIEQGSRVFTGSVYEDLAFSDAFKGEGAKNSSTICVKTHFPCPKCWTYPICSWCAGARPVTSKMTGPIYSAQFNVYLLRSPFDAFLAEFYRIKSGDHAGKLDPSEFTKTPKKKSYETEYDKPTWNQFVNHRLPAYLDSVRFYLGEKEMNEKGDTYRDQPNRRLTKLVFYEHLKSNPQDELVKIFSFFKRIYGMEDKLTTFPYDELDYAKCSLHHNAKEAFHFHRNKSEIFNPWTPVQVDRICQALGEKYWFSDVWGECRSGLLQTQRIK